MNASFAWLFVGLFLTACLPTNDISYVAAPLVMMMYSKSPLVLYWTALFTGLSLDVIEMSPRLGFLGLSYLLATSWTFPWRLYFFKDSKITLPIMTFVFSLAEMLSERLIALFFDLRIAHPAALWFVFHPLGNVAVAFVVFALPTYLWQLYRERIRRRRCSDDT